MGYVLLLTLEYPPQKGGIATYLSRLTDSLPPQTIQVLAQKVKGEHERLTHEADMGSAVPIYRRSLVHRLMRPRWLPSLYYASWLKRKEGRPSLIMVSHVLPMGLVAHRLKRRWQVPYIVILHGMDAALALAAGGRKRRQASQAVAGADRVVVNSRYTAGLAKSLGAKDEQLMVCHPSPGFAPDYKVSDEALTAVRQLLGGEEPRFTVLSASRLVERKGIDDTIRALAKLKLEGRDFRYLVIGDGPDRQRLEDLASDWGIGEETVFAGQLPDDQLAAAYSLSDLFVMTPRGIGPDVEGFGIVYLEANLFGKPVIASRSGGATEAVVDGQTGLLVDADDYKRQAETIARLMDDHEMRQRLGETGRQRVIDHFHWTDQFRPLVKLANRYLEPKNE